MTTLPRSFWYNPNLPEGDRVIPATDEHYQTVKDNPELFDLDHETVDQLRSVGGWNETFMEVLGNMGWIRINMDLTRDGTPAMAMQGDNNEILLKAARQINKFYPLQALLIDTFYDTFNSQSWIELKGREMDHWLRYGKFLPRDKSLVAQFRESVINLGKDEKLWIKSTDPKNAKVVALKNTGDHHSEHAFNHPEKYGLSGNIWQGVEQEIISDPTGPIGLTMFDQGWARYHAPSEGPVILQAKTFYDVAKAIRWLMSNNRSPESIYVSDASENHVELEGKHEIRKFLKQNRKPLDEEELDEFTPGSIKRAFRKKMMPDVSKNKIIKLAHEIQNSGGGAIVNTIAQHFGIDGRLVDQILKDSGFVNMGRGRKASKVHEDLMGVPTPSAKEVAKKHGVPLKQIKAQIIKGVKAEVEHTADKALAREIALDHLDEFPDYYDRLDKAEDPNFMAETLKQVNGKWALVSKSNPKKVLQYYDGPKGKRPSKEWVAKVERRVHSFEDKDSLKLPTLNVGDEMMVGKFKNRRAEIKGFKKDKHNQPIAKTNKGDQQIFKGRIRKLMPEEILEDGGWVKKYYALTRLRKRAGVGPNLRLWEDLNKKIFSKLSEKLDDPELQAYIQDNIPSSINPKYELVLTNTYGEAERVIVMHISPIIPISTNLKSEIDLDILNFDTEQDARNWAAMFQLTFQDTYVIEKDF